MPAQPRYVELPNGSYLEWPEGVSAAEFKAKASKLMQSAESPAPTTGRLNMPMRQAEKIQQQNTPLDATSNATALDRFLPGAGMTVGGMAGGMIAGPVGAAAGAAYGGAAGKAAAQYAAGLDTNAWPQFKGQLENAAVGAGTELGTLALFKGLGAAYKWLRPSSSDEIVPVVEQAARKLTNAINPNPLEADQFIGNAGKQVPNILEYAKRTGNPLNTRLEFSKAAEGAGNEAYGHFYKNVLQPVANKEVSVAGTGYAGKTLGEGGNRATLEAISNRLSAINEELSPAFRQRNAGMVGSKLASEPELRAEAANLRKLLYGELSKSSGLPPEEVEAMRQRYGQLRHIARATNEAVTQRSLAGAKATETGLGSVSTGALAGKAIDAARGKTDAIADRMFQRAIKGFPGEYEPLKAVVPPQVKAVFRDPVWKGVDTSGVEANISILPVEEQKAVVEGMQARLKQRAAKIAEDAEKETKERAYRFSRHGKRPFIGPQEQKLEDIRNHSIYRHVAKNEEGHTIGSHDGENWVDTETGEPHAH